MHDRHVVAVPLQVAQGLWQGKHILFALYSPAGQEETQVPELKKDLSELVSQEVQVAKSISQVRQKELHFLVYVMPLVLELYKTPAVFSVRITNVLVVIASEGFLIFVILNSIWEDS